MASASKADLWRCEACDSPLRVLDAHPADNGFFRRYYRCESCGVSRMTTYELPADEYQRLVRHKKRHERRRALKKELAELDKEETDSSQ